MQTRPFLRGVERIRDSVPDFRRYPFCIPAVRGLDSLSFHESVTFFIGDNGAGKSTLLEALAVACGCCPEGGGRNFQLETRATHSSLHSCLRPLWGPLRPRDLYFLRAESFYNVATHIDQLDEIPATAPPISGSYGGSLHARSHGESFFALLSNRLGADGLYFFDEPEAALSPARQMAALVRMDQLVRAGSQLIIATHSPILLAYPRSRIYQLDGEGIRETVYDQAEPVLLTRQFLRQPEQTVRQLLQEEGNPPPSDG